MSAATWAVRRLHTVGDADLEGLADVLIDGVDAARPSASCIRSLAAARSISGAARPTTWRPACARGSSPTTRRPVCGTVQLLVDQPENQPHRSDFAKMLVIAASGGMALGAAPLRAAEATARDCGKTLLILDTASAAAERIYERMGRVRVGIIHGYALLPTAVLRDDRVLSRPPDVLTVSNACRVRLFSVRTSTPAQGRARQT